jgi:two-component system, OmpR family, phosphate regulon sensor histidine kinase PhoR
VVSALPGTTPPVAADRLRRGSRWWRRLPWTPARIVLAYAAVSVAWIALSDHVIEALISDPIQASHLQTIKGAVFVTLTSIVLAVLMRRGSTGLLARDAEVRATVESMADAVLLVDPRLRIVEANRAAVELFGVGRKDDLLVPLAEWGSRFVLRHADGAPVAFERYATVRAARGERVPAYDALIRRTDGRDVYVSISAAPVEGSTPGLAVAVLRDVSDKRQLDETRDEFLSTAAHELKTPLAVIKAYAQMVQRRQPAEAPALTVVQRQVDRLDRMVQDLLDTSRLRLDTGSRERERLDVAALAAEVVDRAQASAPRHVLSVEAPEPAVVLADRDRVTRVLKNLLDNAVRFSPSGGPVAVSVANRPGEVEVAVRDHGLGIPADRQERVFERYYRAHAGTPHDYGGLGLGLDLSREIVARHGGRMWFESAAGQGSTFHFTLPREGAAA